MAIGSDVLVIGGGIAGLVAGIAASRAGATTTVVSATESTLRQASGLIDVLGYPTPDRGPVVDPVEAIDNLPDDHPYHVVGTDAVEAGLALFDDVAGDLYRGSGDGRNTLVPTAAGTIKPTARYQETMAAGLATDRRNAVVVGFERIPALDGPLAAEWLAAADVPFGVTGVTASFPAEFRTDTAITRYARALDHDETLPTGDGARPVRAALADELRSIASGAERIGLPPVLGLEDPLTVHAELERALDLDVFEVPTGPPSVPGMRLATRLETALREAGGRFHTGAPVIDFETTADGTSIASVTVDRNDSPIPYEADEFVLATGGLVGKGVTATRETVTESVLDCHVDHPDERYDWFDGDVFGEHRFPRFGVSVTGSLRPTDGMGEVEYGNVRAAGAVIGGYDFASELSGSGVSIATGHEAGRLAATGGA